MPSPDAAPAPESGSARSMVRRSGGMAAASAASQVLVAIATLLAARVCDPASFGVLGVFTAVVIVGGTLASMRLEAAVVLPRRDADARRLALIGVVATPIFATLAAAAMHVAGPVVLPRFDAEALLDLPWAVPTGVVALGWRSIVLGWCTRHGQVRTIARARLANGATMAAGLLVAAIVAPTLGVLVATWISAQTAELAVLGLRTVRDPGFARPAARPRRTRRLARRYRRFPLVQMWSFLIEQLGPHLPTAIVAAAFSAEVAGLYAIISRIVGRPMAVIGSAFAVVVQHEASVARRARRPLRPVMAAGLRRLAVAAAIVFVPIAAIGPGALPRLLGPDWIDPGPALLALLPGVVADFVALPLLPVLGIAERIGTQFVGAIARLALVAGTITSLGLAGISPIVMMLTVAVLVLGVDAAMLAIAWRAAGRVVAAPQESN